VSPSPVMSPSSSPDPSFSWGPSST
jgi:hypothetical protein